jgi:hypothetical protein
MLVRSHSDFTYRICSIDYSVSTRYFQLSIIRDFGKDNHYVIFDISVIMRASYRYPKRLSKRRLGVIHRLNNACTVCIKALNLAYVIQKNWFYCSLGVQSTFRGPINSLRVRSTLKGPKKA